MAEKTQEQVVLSTLAKRKAKGFTDAELIEATGIVHADTIRSKLAKAGKVVIVGAKKNPDTNRTLKTYSVAA